MKTWAPEITNADTPIVHGPATRRLVTARMRPKRVLSLLRRLTGDRMATWATRVLRLLRRSDMTIVYDAEHRLYVSRDVGLHAFSHPKRLWTVFDGHRARGKRLAYEYLLDQIGFADGDRIIDIGANAGDLGLVFQAMRVRVDIQAFEPSPGDYAALSFNLEACSAVRRFEAHQIALWNEDSAGLTFYLAPGNADSSVIPFKGWVGKVEVAGRRLDTVLTPGAGRYRLMKLEAEGAEPEILQGAGALIRDVDYMSVDVGFERGDDQQSTLPEVANHLIRNGFEIVGYEGGRHVVLFRNMQV